MSDMEAAMGLDSFSEASPPPKSFAWASSIKVQVTASIMPRTASARRAWRVRFCRTVRIWPLTAP